MSRRTTLHKQAALAALAGLLAVASVLASGCAHAPAVNQARERSASVATGLAVEDLESQSLFRVHYQGEAGSGGFRLVLKLARANRYLIETKDRFGRGLWRIEADSSRRVLIDDRRRVFCETEAGIRIPEIAMESLPLSQLPAILLGRLPGELEPSGGEGEYRDVEGRLWTVKATGSELSSWTLWEGEEPWVWWMGAPSEEGVLSHRSGTQLRWKRVAIEPMSVEIPRLALSEDYVEVSCEAWPGTASNGTGGH